MNPFWGSFSEQFKDCGRNATLFLITLGGVFLLLVLTAWVLQTDLRDSLPYALPVTAFFLLVWLAIAVRRAIVQGRERSKYPRLSSDELSKARSKLLKNRNGTSL